MRLLSMIREFLDALDDSRIGDAIGLACLSGCLWVWLMVGAVLTGSVEVVE